MICVTVAFFLLVPHSLNEATREVTVHATEGDVLYTLANQSDWLVPYEPEWCTQIEKET